MKKYDLEFKKEAVKLSQEIGIEAAAGELNIPADTLAEWRKKRSGVGMLFQASIKESREDKKQGVIEEYIRENLELKKQLADERQSNEILKAALDFFGQGQKG